MNFNELLKWMPSKASEFIGFFDGNTVVPLNDAGGKSKYLCLIANKNCFLEIEKDFPITNKADLKKAIKYSVEDICPFANFEYFYVSDINTKSAKVHFWFYKKTVLDDILRLTKGSARLLIPENYLYATGLRNNSKVYDLSNENDGYVCENNHSKINFANILLSDFKIENMRPSDEVLNVHDDKVNYIRNRMWLFFKALPHFLLPVNKSKNKERYSKWMKYIAFSAVSYSVISTAVLYSIDSFTQKRLEEYRTHLNALKVLKNDYNSQNDELAKFNVVVDDASQQASRVFIDLAKTSLQFEIEQISILRNKVYITADTLKPAEVLKEFIQNEELDNVELANNIRDLVNSEQKRFTVTYKY